MRGALRRRLILLSVLLIVGALAGGAIVVLDAQKVIPGNNEELISVVKLPQTAHPATQRAGLQAEHDALALILIDIASNNSTVHNLISGKNYTVVGVGVDKGGSPHGPNDVGTALLVIKVDDTFYAIVEDVPQKKVTAVEKRACYGPLCDR